LTAWGIPQDVINKVIGVPMTDPGMTIKNFATANRLDFETIKTALQAEVDRVKK
jgi:hypothetical protein